MTTDDQQQFAEQLAQRFEDLAQWAVSHWPDRERPLTLAHFEQARREMTAVATGRYPSTEENAQQPKGEPEPEQGGEQYIDVTPAPWP